MHYERIFYSAIASLFLLGTVAQCATIPKMQLSTPAKAMSNCPAAVSLAAHQTLVEAVELEKHNEFERAFQITLHTAASIDPNCRTRASLETDAAAIEFRAGSLSTRSNSARKP